MFKVGDIVEFNDFGISLYKSILKDDVYKTYTIEHTASHNHVVVIRELNNNLVGTIIAKTDSLKNITRLYKIKILLNKKED